MEEGQQEGKRSSAKAIRKFIQFYNIDMNEFDPSDINAYPTFEDFFVRKHRNGSRPICEENNEKIAICVADSRVVTYESVPQAKKLWIKGSDFSITNLVMDTQLGSQFTDGAIASFRLSPQDYHRYHSPVTGIVKQFRSIPGDYYQVDPVAITSKVDILTRNARDYIVIDSKEFGLVLFVAIGATDVGSVRSVPFFLFIYFFFEKKSY
jgi:phosphatidylserine decarboxylase